jgi:hypothetical protein
MTGWGSDVTAYIMETPDDFDPDGEDIDYEDEE